MVIARQSPAEEAGGVVPDGGPHNPRALHNPIHNFEPRVAEGIVAMDEAVEEGSGLDRVLGGKVEDGGMGFAARDLEIYGDDKGFHRFSRGLGSAKGSHDAVVRAAEDIIEPRRGAEPVDAGGSQEPVAAGDLLTARKVVFAAKREEIAGWGGPAVGSRVEIDKAEGATIDRLLDPSGGVAGGGDGGGGVAGEV